MAKKFDELINLSNFVLPNIDCARHNQHIFSDYANIIAYPRESVSACYQSVFGDIKGVRSLFIHIHKTFTQLCQTPRMFCKGRKVRLEQTYCLRNRHLMNLFPQSQSSLLKSPHKRFWSTLALCLGKECSKFRASLQHNPKSILSRLQERSMIGATKRRARYAESTTTRSTTHIWPLEGLRMSLCKVVHVRTFTASNFQNE